MIYLDNNATTRPDEGVVVAMTESVREHWSNPSSVHRAGQQARQRIELARRSLANLLGVRPRTITLVGSGTESIDLAVRGTLLALGGSVAAHNPAPVRFITAMTEHSAVRELAQALQREAGVPVSWVELDTDGRVSVESVRALLAQDPGAAIVSIQWANNETGAVQPVQEIARLCRARSEAGMPTLFHCDATQWVGRMPTRLVNGEIDALVSPSSGEGAWERLCTLDCDLLTCSPHKFHGIKGVGVLYTRAGVRVSPLIHGEQELGRRGGTENVPGIAGAGVAAELAMRWLADRDNIRRGAELRDRFERGVLTSVPGTVVNGARVGAGGGTDADNRLFDRLWNTSNIAFPRLEAEALLLLLSERGVCASAGAACSSGSLDPSPVLRAMGVPDELAHGSLRFSISRETTMAEIDEAVGVIAACAARLRQSMTSAW